MSFVSKLMDNKILVTGGDGRFAKVLKSKNKKLNLIFCSKKQLDILNLKSIKKNFEGAHVAMHYLKEMKDYLHRAF